MKKAPIIGTSILSLLQAVLDLCLSVNRTKRKQGRAAATLPALISSEFVNASPTEVDREITAARRRQSNASLRAGFSCALALVFGLMVGLALTARAEPTHPFADTGYVLRAWSTEDGLPENSATAIVQTGEGYLWFGTFRGLVRYNGDKFEVFDPGNTPQLPNQGIVNLHADKRGRLWVSTYAGLVVKHGTQWRPVGTNEGWAGNQVRSFAERGNGDLLITTFDGHVLTFENDRLTELPSPPGEPGRGYLGTVDESGQWWLAQKGFVGYWNGQRWVEAYKPDPTVGRSAIACGVARGGGVWVLLSQELLKFRGSSLVSQRSFPELKGGIWSLSEDSRTNLWICSYDSGLFQITPLGGLRHWTRTNGLGSLSTRMVLEDREENLWIGSSGGGLRRLTQRRFLELAGPGYGKVVRSVAPARNGGVWMAVFEGGLSWRDATGGARVSVPGPNNERPYGSSVLEDRVGRLWYGEQDGCWVRQGQDRFEKVPLKPSEGAGVSALFEDSKGRVWIGTQQGAVMYDGSRFRQLEPDAGLPRGEVDCFGEDHSGGLWVAGSAGVFRREKDQFTPVRDADKRPLRGVLCFKSDADGTMWMGTRGAGLIRWRNGRMDRIGVEHGLPDREVRGIIEDESGYFWMPSNRGIVRASRKQLHAVADNGIPRLESQLLDQHDGLPSPECSTAQPNCAHDATGKLWFATQKGPAVIDPAGFRLNTQPPPVPVEQMSYYVPTARSKANLQHLPSAPHEGEVRLTAPFSEPIQLPPGASGLDITFAALSLSAPEKVRYQYHLEGHTRDWEDHTTDRLVRFPRLPPGDYVFRVRAANNDGVWNEAGTSLAFSVLPFFWQTGWFRLGTALLLLALGGTTVWGVAHRRIARALERERVAHEMRALREELAHSDRVSGLAQLASGLAHELGQPLGAILRNAEAAEMLIEESPPDLAEIRAILTDIRQDDQRAAGVIQRMRSMLKRKPTDRIPLSIAELLPEVVALVRHNLLQRQVQLSVEVPPGLPAVRGDRIQLQQVLLNLLLNGMDSMNQQPPDTRHLTIGARICTGAAIEVRVRDSGPGVPAENVARVFEPFFSTKQEGMGIGLAVSKSIIEAHQGRIWVENRPEGGACFCFTVPVAHEERQGA